MPTVLLQGRLAVQREALLRARLDERWRITTWQPGDDPVEDFAPRAAAADMIVGGAIPLESWPPVPKLKLFQIPWTGHEWTSAGRMPKGVPVCNCFEHEISIAEYVLAAMLEWQVGLRRMDRDFRARGWGGLGVASGPQHGELYGGTLGVIGYGHIGHEVAVRARAFGMKVVGVRRAQPPCPPELEWLGTMDRLDELLAVSDFVLVACGLNAETRGLIDAPRLARMQPGAVIVNVARGAIIDEAALYSALKARQIGGAVLDVWYNYQEPGEPDVWPSNLPFHELDNVICSAHESASTQAQVERRWDFVAANLNRVARGEAPLNLLYRGTGG
ncbi:MAG TPA: 2-hydroxyacid dehydrogenase [Thermohalobaculum sp.]|nr:2-hydroxyacid dehydrogenase [Thermohalobaculum sp.]